MAPSPRVTTPTRSAAFASRSLTIPRWGVLLLAVLGEVIFTIILRSVPIVGALHAAILGALGFWAVARRDLGALACVFAYLTGSEILWRQARSPLPYLAAPYLMILLSAFAIVMIIGKVSRIGQLAILYMTLLLPPIVITARTGGDDARELIAFALSGPIALGTFIALASQLKASPALYRRVLWATLISTLGPLTMAISDVRETIAVQGSITFSTQSNSVTSGGFGPVQVSSALGLGVLASVLLLLSERERIPRLIAAIAGFILIVQTLLTFSRGGSFSVAIAVAILAIAQANNRRVRNRVAAVAAVSLVLAYFLVFPWLDSFTAGKFQERFSSTRSARTELAANDTEIFKRNFLFGVGPGMTKYQRLTYTVCQLRNDKCNGEASSHTEFTRMLGEHGIPGIMAMIVLVALAAEVVRASGRSRPFTLAFLGWAVSQMFYANLRVVAVPFAFGMAFLGTIERVDEPDEPANDNASSPSVGQPIDVPVLQR